VKILLIQETDWIDKGPFQQNHLMEKLSLRGHEIHVIDYQIQWRDYKYSLFNKRTIYKNTNKIYDGAYVDVFRPGFIKIPTLDYLSLLINLNREIQWQLKYFKPDIIVGFHILSAYLGMNAARKAFLPFIYYWVDVYHTQIPVKAYHPLGIHLEKKALSSADHVVAINDQLIEYVISLGTAPKKTHVIKGSVDTSKFNINLDGTKTRDELGINNNDIVLFFVGWIYHFSGLKEVAKKLVDADDRFKLLIVGDGDAHQDLIEIREQHGLGDKLILTGKVPYQEVPKYIAAADICLLPAYTSEKIMQEIVPIKFYEYMAMSKPVIATKLPGVMKEFGDDNGVVYVDGPEDVMPQAVELINSDSLIDLGKKARSFVERNNWDNVTDEFESLMLDAVNRRDSKKKI
jgi:glycosyltransferase involved in cell wall biosynthesis